MLTIEPYTGAVTDALWQLLLEADPDRAAVSRYLASGEIVIAYWEHAIVGVAVLTALDGEYELRNISVAGSHQGRGIAKALIAAVKARATSLGANRLLVGTGNSSLDQFALYQKSGFRFERIERDYFAGYQPPICENGIRCLDRICLYADLSQ
ncbi:GNAT family N-acetyltransferase [Halieaceae bacterium IMCC14734]|uniref:GNAT family N-acetyltransferase n=1 Tax=Candidatus Litorirhabdus singularis TaxID=2518993 RepID=A0ABT3TLI0_9GAMM|nr:GNAT family N-acetyltransferase [Candidatus Litorirhabdus singularis]MCX2983153.1 GNAT family N-acetyltransferase [Candidatus Litorirhabdus singularis]